MRGTAVEAVQRGGGARGNSALLSKLLLPPPKRLPPNSPHLFTFLNYPAHFYTCMTPLTSQQARGRGGGTDRAVPETEGIWTPYYADKVYPVGWSRSPARGPG